MIPCLADKYGECIKTYFGDKGVQDNKDTKYYGSTDMVLTKLDDNINDNLNEDK